MQWMKTKTIETKSWKIQFSIGFIKKMSGGTIIVWNSKEDAYYLNKLQNHLCLDLR